MMSGTPLSFQTPGQARFVTVNNGQPMLWVSGPVSNNVMVDGIYDPVGPGPGDRNQPVYAFDYNNGWTTEIVYVDGNEVPFVNSVIMPHDFMAAEEDTEIPSYTLDHMYAKKPREPGAETAPKPRRRTKRREQQALPEYIVPDQTPLAPKINIIRQRLPSSVYKSLAPTKPKILQGAQTKGVQSSSGFVASQNSLRGKEKNTMGGNSSGRSAKKEDPLAPQGTYVPIIDDSHGNQSRSNSNGNGSKIGKDPLSTSKCFKHLLSKANPSPNSGILDDLQSRAVSGPGYDEEMLFDFGISEDDDEVNACTLSNEVSEAFNDVVFDECEFGSGLESYPTSVSSQNPFAKPSSPRSSGIGSFVQSNRSSKRIVSSITPSLPFGVSDDDDSNQIMISMDNRRRSREWDGLDKVEIKSVALERENFKDVIRSSLDSKTETDTSDTNVLSPPASIPDATAVSSDSAIELLNKDPCIQETIDNIKVETNLASEPEEEISMDKLVKTKAISNKPKVSTNSSTPIDERRRSGRAVKAPAWLEDNVDTSKSKKRRSR